MRLLNGKAMAGGMDATGRGFQDKLVFAAIDRHARQLSLCSELVDRRVPRLFRLG